MGRTLHYRPGSWYITDDRTGFPQRVERTRRQWNNVVVDEKVWEPRQPQDLVKGVMDKQGVPLARPLAPNVFVGPILTTTTQAAIVGQDFLYIASTAGFAAGDSITVMLDSGAAFATSVLGDPGAGFIGLTDPLPYTAASGNTVTDLSYAFDAAPFTFMVEP